MFLHPGLLAHCAAHWTGALVSLSMASPIVFTLRRCFIGTSFAIEVYGENNFRAAGDFLLPSVGHWDKLAH